MSEWVALAHLAALFFGVALTGCALAWIHDWLKGGIK